MGFVSRYNFKTIVYMNQKYKSYNVIFESFDDYIMFLFYNLCKRDEKKYYSKLEDDFIEYSNWQEKRLREVNCEDKE